nr:hypothetical protein [Candidatus Kapabacteria bacterium]
ICLANTQLCAENQKIFISAKLGAGFQTDVPSQELMGYKLHYSNCVGASFSAFINIKNNFAAHISYLSYGYMYRISDQSPIFDKENYYLQKENYSDFSIAQGIACFGIAYKYEYKKITILPFVDFGYRPVISSDFSNFVLAEHNSNNQKSFDNYTKSESSLFAFTCGTDMFFQIGKHWGITAGIQYCTFNPTTKFSTVIWDNSDIQEELDGEAEFNPNNVILSLGVYLSFWEEK